jgi:hypothetical protein
MNEQFITLFNDIPDNQDIERLKYIHLKIENGKFYMTII